MILCDKDDFYFMETQMTTAIDCVDCRVSPPPSFFTRYRDFLLSRDTLLTFANAALLLAGFIISLLGASELGQWLYLAAAIIGGLPLFLFALALVLREPWPAHLTLFGRERRP